MKTHRFHRTLLSVSLLGLFAPSLLNAQVLPLTNDLSGYTLPGGDRTVIATWGGKGTLTSGSDFWADDPGSTPVASGISGYGTFNFSASKTQNTFGGRPSYLSASNSTYTISTANYSGAVPDILTLQLSMNGTAGVKLDPNHASYSESALTLTIGSTIYDLGDAIVAPIVTNYHTSGYDDARFDGTYASSFATSLYTFSWNLSDLGYTGSMDAFSFVFSSVSTTMLYDAQVSVASIPEPSTYCLLAGGIGGLLLLRRRYHRA